MAATSAAETNKALVRRAYEEIIDEKHYEAVTELYADDFVSHRPPPGADEAYADRDSIVAYVRGLHEAFPDLTATIHGLVAEDDMVTARLTFSGTHEGAFLGVEGSGTAVSFDSLVWFRVEDGELAEAWGVTDTLDLVHQLGISEVPSG